MQVNKLKNAKLAVSATPHLVLKYQYFPQIYKVFGIHPKEVILVD